MSQHYNANYSIEQISDILTLLKDCILEDRYYISKNNNRAENNAFIQKYNLSHSKQKDILLRIQTKDFCYTLNNINIGYEHEILYVFLPANNDLQH
jgi:hypothetical protein